MSEDKLAINDKEIADLFINLEKDFDVQYSTSSESDNALLRRLYSIYISIDWIEIIQTYTKYYK